MVNLIAYGSWTVSVRSGNALMKEIQTLATGRYKNAKSAILYITRSS
jgi:hypothetical protein